MGIKCQIRFSVGNSKCWCQNQNWQCGCRLVSVWITASHCREGLWFRRLTQLSSRYHLGGNLSKQEPIRLRLPTSRRPLSPEVLSGIAWCPLPPVEVLPSLLGDGEARWAGPQLPSAQLSAVTSGVLWRHLRENGVRIDPADMKWPSRLETWFI